MVHIQTHHAYVHMYHIVQNMHSHAHDTVFRLGKSLDNFRAALQTIHLGNPILRLIVTLIKLNRGLYLLLDHLIWAARMRFVNLQMSYWNDRANSFWMLAIFLSLLRDLYELAVAVRAEWKRLKSQSVGGKQPPSAVQVVRGVAHSHPALVLDVVKNGADLLIPSARLGLVRLSDGTVGLAGVVSSMAGLASMWKDNWKLIFS